MLINIIDIMLIYKYQTLVYIFMYIIYTLIAKHTDFFVESPVFSACCHE